jgi:uncharacterized protein (TIGR02246 family)
MHTNVVVGRPWRSLCRLVAVAALVLASGCAHTGANRGAAELAEVRAAIEAANAEFARALVRGDAPAAAAVFAEDAEIVPASGRGFVSGRAAIQEYQASRLQARRYLDVAITTVQLGVSGDLAWETGTNRVTMQQGESPPVTVTGRYLAVWERQPDGAWRIQADLPVLDPSP